MYNYVRLTCVFALGAIASFGQTITPAPPFVETTGMIGIADAQTAQLNLLNPGVLPPAMGAICTAAVAFVGADSTVLKSTTLAVPPDKSMSFDLHSDTDLNLAVGDHREIRVVISVPAIVPVAASATPAPACKVIPTLEMIDNSSGRTLVVLGHVEAVPAAPATNP